MDVLYIILLSLHVCDTSIEIVVEKRFSDVELEGL